MEQFNGQMAFDLKDLKYIDIISEDEIENVLLEKVMSF